MSSTGALMIFIGLRGSRKGKRMASDLRRQIEMRPPGRGCLSINPQSAIVVTLCNCFLVLGEAVEPAKQGWLATFQRSPH
jgi:hypothetical protein